MCAYQQSVRIKRVLLLSVKKHLLLQQNTKEIKEDIYLGSSIKHLFFPSRQSAEQIHTG